MNSILEVNTMLIDSVKLFYSPFEFRLHSILDMRMYEIS